MSSGSIWFSAESILSFFAQVFSAIGDILSFLFGVRDVVFSVGGFDIYPLDIILAVLLAGVIMFYMTFSEKYEQVVQKREARIKDMYLKPSITEVKNKRWENISYLIRTPNPADWKIAIIDCDNMLDDLFQRLGYPGATLGERMKSANTANFPTLNDAWEAHKVRNLIAHSSGFQLDSREALRIYYLYERVFRDAGYI